MIDTYADEMNEARQRKKQLRPVFLNEQETAQENKKQVPAFSPNTNIEDILRDFREVCFKTRDDLYNERQVSISDLQIATEKAKTQLEALLSAAKIEGEIKGLNKIKATPSTYSWPGLDKRIKFLEKELEQQ